MRDYEKDFDTIVDVASKDIIDKIENDEQFKSHMVMGNLNDAIEVALEQEMEDKHFDAINTEVISELEDYVDYRIENDMLDVVKEDIKNLALDDLN